MIQIVIFSELKFDAYHNALLAKTNKPYISSQNARIVRFFGGYCSLTELEKTINGEMTRHPEGRFTTVEETSTARLFPTPPAPIDTNTAPTGTPKLKLE